MAELASWVSLSDSLKLPDLIRALNTRLARAMDLLSRIQRDSVRTITASETLTEGDDLVGLNTASATVIATLPPAASMRGRHITLKKLSASNTATAASGGGSLVDGAASFSWTTNNAAFTFESNGSAWWIV